MSKNPVTFPGLRSLSLTGLEQSHLLRPIDPASGVSSELQDGMDSDSAVRLFRGPKSPSGSPNKYRELCDDRLANLSVSFWTSVQIPNDLAAKAISMYLETDHPLLGTFEPTQFVGDLVNHQQTSCSPFLANCVLYWGCQMYSAIDKRLNDYAKDFGKESERLWDIVKSSDSSLNMIGAQMLSLAYMGNGKDHKVLKYQLEAVKMGARLGLLGVDRKTAEARLRKLPQSHLVAYSYAAWGVFNWAVLVSIFYRQPGVLHLRFPPTLPIPGTSGQYDPISSHPIVQDALPEYMGYTFPAICEFWQIVREVSLAYFAQGKDPSDNVPLNFAEMKYREILAWAENLPVQITRDSNCPHHVVIFHMWIHATILDIFRPFMKQGYANSQRLRTFSAADSTPDAAFKASVNQLKQLIFDYRSSYESSAYTILWQTALTYLATSVLQDTADPSWRPWFMLCIYGYETLRRPYRVAEAIGGGLLTMTMRDTDITTEDARKILNDLKYRGLTAPVDEEIRATFMGDLNMAIKNPEGARMENLAKAFEEVALLKDYTHGIEDTEMD
ncbi:hypothetical protein BKA67DRAFT_593606 [Truncatella angustata]|uniref:Uncharacterized protein n=1 Tax=Truncatella angustata TaxID=152316 RepID=A0A9P8ZVF7_9PEZI|nr:uncharacterized protein BKA67DRAFT_593606 [Truncatella angustata]KAH6651916.1 hypothetical protein BKA67DRAFT_593606 [Truncatella angustata]